ncbi:GNAT family N-acetyltransferase [Nitratireductor sp. CAU 1489]|uniref:GNAT family N-acetyltransferase n=1 Tax=Nitratireductor arenosus TaxID=2682096 RepID=A0A844QG74_9HYPH|nr:N-acetyltransferase [Nitratireductor arenosus]MVA98285.1 GNAT family N-acetyltransferase [Nitratireductor arenosus]
MTEPRIRTATDADRAAIFAVEEAAFSRTDEAELVDAIRRDGDAVLELVAERDGAVVGHVLFSRLVVEDGASRFSAFALAPAAVAPDFQGCGVGTALILEGHRRLRAAGERLGVVLGDPAYYGRFGYTHRRAAGFDSLFQGDALQALAWGGAPTAGHLVYPRAFGVG